MRVDQTHLAGPMTRGKWARARCFGTIRDQQLGHHRAQGLATESNDSVASSICLSVVATCWGGWGLIRSRLGSGVLG
jgi:hypothetical protein